LDRTDVYKDLVDAFAEGRIDIAYFGGCSFLAASGRTPTAPLVMRRMDGRFRSYFITRAGSKASSLEDLKGMRFAFGANDSTSGYLMPLYYLKEMGIDPDKDFQGPRANASNLIQIHGAGQRFREELRVQGRGFAFAGDAVFPRMPLEQG
jgi:ABC-type phosphate/phosphonate transport system substrate-binding protein